MTPSSSSSSSSAPPPSLPGHRTSPRRRWVPLIAAALMLGAGIALIVLAERGTYLWGCVLLGLAVLVALRTLVRGRWRGGIAAVAAAAVGAGAAWMPLPLTSWRMEAATVWQRADLEQDPGDRPFISADRLVMAENGRVVEVDTATGETLSDIEVEGTFGGESSLRFAADGVVFLHPAPEDGLARVWRVADGEAVALGPFEVVEHGVAEAIASRDGYTVVRVCPAPDDDLSAAAAPRCTRPPNGSTSSTCAGPCSWTSTSTT